MKIRDMITLLEGKLISETDNLDREVKGGCGADLMSDVLAFIQPDAVLLTGLCNPQVVRTAHMADVAAIVVVRGKIPPQETIDLANEENIPLISTPLGTFELCGRLFAAGLPSLEKPVGDDSCSCDE
jgi:predicted transcriptional regulator